MNKVEKLKSQLTKVREELNSNGFKYNADSINNYDVIAVFEDNYKRCVENIFKESFNDVVENFDIFETMCDGVNDEQIIEEIVNHVSKRYLAEGIEKCDVLGCCVEKGHTIEEYKERFGELYDAGELWDFSKEDFEEGAVEPNPDICYWLIEVDGEPRYFETDADRALESLKLDKELDSNEKELNEGTSNFPTRFPHGFPLLVFYTYDEVYDKMKYADGYPQEADFEDDNGRVDEDAYYEARDEFEEKFWNDLDCCALDEDDVERLENELHEFNSKTRMLASERYDADTPDDARFNDLSLLDEIELKIEPGYYEAAYIDVDNEDNLDHMDSDFANEHIKRISEFLEKLERDFGLTSLEVAYGPASNGETGYRKVKKESLKEDAGDYSFEELFWWIYGDEDPLNLGVVFRDTCDLIERKYASIIWEDEEADGEPEKLDDEARADILNSAKKEAESWGRYDIYNMPARYTDTLTLYKGLKELLGADCKYLNEALKSKSKVNKSINESYAFKSEYAKKAWLLNEIVSCINDEDAYYGSWIYLWPDGESEEQCEEDFGNKVDFKELEDLFIRLYKRYHKEGLYRPGKEAAELAKEYDKKLGLDEIELIGGLREEKKKRRQNVHVSVGGDPEKSTAILNTMLDAGSAPAGPVALSEEEGVARVEYCVMVDGDNYDCFEDEEEAVKCARRLAQFEENKDANVRVLLVKYGPKDEHGDEPELGIETIWAVRFDESLKEDKDQDELGLPKEVTFTASEVALDTDDEDPSERLGDLLSDKYGFCHYGFKFDVKKNEAGEPSEFRCYDIDWDTSESLKEDVSVDDPYIADAYAYLENKGGFAYITRIRTDKGEQTIKKGFEDEKSFREFLKDFQDSIEASDGQVKYISTMFQGQQANYRPYMKNESLKSLKEAKCIDQKFDEAKTKDGKLIGITLRMEKTPNYTHEYAYVDYDGKHYVGHDKWMNRPWYRFTYGNALEDALSAINKELAHEACRETSNANEALKYFAERL